MEVSIGSSSRSERVELERRGLAQRAGAVLAADPRHHRGDRARVARVRMVLGAVRGGDRRRAAADRDRPEPAVGLGGQERRDRGRRRRDRREAALRAPGREQQPVALVRAPGRRRERALRVALGALELALERRRRGGGSGCWEGSVGHG